MCLPLQWLKCVISSQTLGCVLVKYRCCQTKLFLKLTLNRILNQDHDRQESRKSYSKKINLQLLTFSMIAKRKRERVRKDTTTMLLACNTCPSAIAFTLSTVFKDSFNKWKQHQVFLTSAALYYLWSFSFTSFEALCHWWVFQKPLLQKILSSDQFWGFTVLH